MVSEVSPKTSVAQQEQIFEPTTLTTIPAEIFYHILSYLPVKYTAQMNQICKQIVVPDEHIHRLLIRHFSLQSAEKTPTITQLKEQYLLGARIRNGVYATQSKFFIPHVSMFKDRNYFRRQFDRPRYIHFFDDHRTSSECVAIEGDILNYVMDTKRLAISLANHSLKIWDRKENKWEMEIENANEENCEELILYDSFLFSKTINGTIKIWDLFAKNCCLTLPLQTRCTLFQFENGKLLIDMRTAEGVYLDFTAPYSEILDELASLLGHSDLDSVHSASNRFERLAPRITNAINRKMEADTKEYKNASEKLEHAIKQYRSREILPEIATMFSNPNLNIGDFNKALKRFHSMPSQITQPIYREMDHVHGKNYRASLADAIERYLNATAP